MMPWEEAQQARQTAVSAPSASKPWEEAAAARNTPQGISAQYTPQGIPDADIPREIGRGMIDIIPALAGAPVDAVTDMLNLGRAAYGVAKHELTGSNDLPQPIDRSAQFGGSDWWRQIRGDKIMGASIGPDEGSDTPAGRMARTAGSVFAGGGRNAARMVAPAVGAAVGAETGGPLGGVVGALAPGAVGALRGQPKTTVKPESFLNAREAGYTVPPSEVMPTPGNRMLEKTAGKADTQQVAAVRSQDITNRLIREDFNLPRNLPLSDKIFEGIIAKNGYAYKAVRDSGAPIKANDAYIDGVAKLGQEFQAAAKEFPALLKNSKVTELQDALLVSEMSPTAAVELSKKLRQNAKTNLKAFDDVERQTLGRAQRDAAHLVEDLVEQNLRASGKGALADAWAAGRQKIAQAYDAMSALNTGSGNIDGRHYAKLLEKGVPLTGGARKVAEFADAFKKAAIPPEVTGSSAAGGWFTRGAIGSAAGSLVGGGPVGAALGAAAAVGVPIAARSVILSGPYQNALAARLRPRPDLTRENALAAYLASQQE